MPSPFPGMDPFLESPAHWPDLHDRLAASISAYLNESLPRPYYAQLANREQVGVFTEDKVRRIIPDVAIGRFERATRFETSETATAVLERPRSDLSEFEIYEVIVDRETLRFVEVRDAKRGHEIVTVIEIISPSTKQPGRDLDDYLKKRTELLESTTSLIEIDLLRKGRRLWAGMSLEQQFQRTMRPTDYVAVVNRGWDRPRDITYRIFRAPLQSSLPVIPVPLRQGEAEIPLDLQFVFNRAYREGPYSRSIDYSMLQDADLPDELTDWGRTLSDAAAKPF